MFWNFRRPKSITVTNLNDFYRSALNEVDYALGKRLRHFKRAEKQGSVIFVLEFNGDVMASQVENLRHEVTSCLFSAKKGDTVLVKVNSPGGAAHTYGYVASQLNRIKKAGIPLIVSIDKVAASGGYMAACIADRIIAAPFAIIGSIGVVAELPNFNKLLNDFGVEYKQYTAGKFKRTVSTMGKITEEGEAKFQEDLQTTYDLFCDHVKFHRPRIDIEQVATGEHWQAIKAIDNGLVDEILTSDEYLVGEILKGSEVLQLAYIGNKPSVFEKFGMGLASGLMKIFLSYFTQTNWKV